MRALGLSAVAAAILISAGSQEPASGPIPLQDAHPIVRTVHYIEREMFVPVLNALPKGLDVLEVYIDTPGRHPLVVLTHGSSVKQEEHASVTPWSQLNQARWFARRGYLVLVVVRKGYGRSSGVEDGRSGGCHSRGTFADAGEASATDLRDVIQWGVKLPEVDPEMVLSAGVSTGGFAQVALSADPPKELKAAISFAGGRGSDGKGHDCDLDSLVGAFHAFGKSAAKHGPLPMLWIYSENDHYFPPEMATQFDAAYRKGGGTDEFVMAPPDGDDGHHLYGHPDVWSATVTAFLKERGMLPLGDALLPPPPVPDIPPPANLGSRGVEAWKHYLIAAPYRAFAISENGGWGYAAAAFNQQIANDEAVERCGKSSADGKGGKCVVVAMTPGVK